MTIRRMAEACRLCLGRSNPFRFFQLIDHLDPQFCELTFRSVFAALENTFANDLRFSFGHSIHHPFRTAYEEMLVHYVIGLTAT
jgi:hypothetical protein